MKQHTLRGALPILAKFLGRKLGVKVIIGGDQARTDGQTIILPALPDNDTAQLLAHGYLDHEGAHVRYTDFTAAAMPTPLGRALVNILEDIRIEKALGQALPGSRHNLNRLVTHLVEQGDFWTVPDAQAHPAQQIQAYLLFRLRASLLNQTAMQPLADQAEALLRQTLPSGTMTRLSALAFEVGKTSSTGEVRELAQRILQMLAEEQRQAEEKRQGQVNHPTGASQSTPGSSVPEDNEDTGDAKSTEGDKPDEPDAGNPDTQDSGPGGASSDDEALSSSAAGSSDSQENSRNPSADPTSAEAEDDNLGTPLNGNPVPDSERVTDQENGHIGGDTSGQTGGRTSGTDPNGDRLHQLLNSDPEAVDTPLGDLGQTLAVQLNRVAGDPEVAPVMAEFDPVLRTLDSAILTQRVRAATVALRRRLAGLVEAQRRDAVRRARQGRHLACRQLYRLRCREAGIFEKKTRRPAPDTAVYLLLDRSGSMAGTPLQVASEATLATALALEEIPGCQTAALAFPGSSGDRVIPLLDFAERASPVAGRFRLLAQGTTPMAGALWRAAYGLLLRPEVRRLLIVITDGEPDQLRATEDIIQRCRQAGIEVYGLGIGLDEPVKALFGASRAVSITEIEALPAALFGVLEQALLAA